MRAASAYLSNHKTPSHVVQAPYTLIGSLTYSTGTLVGIGSVLIYTGFATRLAKSRQLFIRILSMFRRIVSQQIRALGGGRS